jgi:hypothetical protein
MEIMQGWGGGVKTYDVVYSFGSRWTLFNKLNKHATTLYVDLPSPSKQNHHELKVPVMARRHL